MLTSTQIDFLNDVCPNKWSEENGVINVECGVNIMHRDLIQIPVQFGKILGNFECNNNKLTTLKGCPNIITGIFLCDYNQLSNLEGGPEKIDRGYSCSNNQLTSLEGCPRINEQYLACENNPPLHILYGIGNVKCGVYYDNINDLNYWIITEAKCNIFVSYYDIAQWIKDNNRLEFLLGAQQEIRQHFSPRILHLADFGFYNESRILDYKKFSRIC